jgi:uncharacterized protein
MRQLKSRLAIATALLILSCLCLDSCVSAYFYDKAVARNSKDFISKSKDLSKPAKGKSAKDYSAWIKTQAYETVSIQSGDGLKLVGYYLPATTASAETVILAHGYSSRGLQMSEFARFYHEKLGYNVLMPDARGHGESEGNYVGFGWPERLDYLRWIEWVQGRVGADSRIALHGISMGGATVLMASGEALPPNVRAIIEDCGYTSAYDELAYQIKRMYKLDPVPIIPDTSRLTKKRAGYTFEEASALDQVRKSRTPILFIHGDADTFVPFEMVKILYEACPAEKELFIVPGAGHGEAFGKDRPGYEARVAAFLEKHP